MIITFSSRPECLCGVPVFLLPLRVVACCSAGGFGESLPRGITARRRNHSLDEAVCNYLARSECSRKFTDISQPCGKRFVIFRRLHIVVGLQSRKNMCRNTLFLKDMPALILIPQQFYWMRRLKRIGIVCCHFRVYPFDLNPVLIIGEQPSA